MEVKYPAYNDRAPKPAALYVRPHDLDISRSNGQEGCLKGKVVHIHPAGAVTRVQVERLDGEGPVHVELSPDRLSELGLRTGEEVYVAPRKVRVFVPEADYAI